MHAPVCDGVNGVQSAGLAPVDDDWSEKTLPRLLVETLSGSESAAVHTLPALLRSDMPTRTPAAGGQRAGDIL